MWDGSQMRKLDKLLLELVDIATLYRATEYPDVKDHYDNYAKILINWDVPSAQQDSYLKCWEKMRG